MKGKIIISSVCLILVVGVVIGAVVVHSNKNNESEVATHNNAVKTMCQNTHDKQLCESTLSTVSNTSDPNAYIASAVKATTDSVIKALNMSDRLAVEHGGKDQGVKMALEDCKDLLQSAMDSLELSMNLVGDNNIKALHDQSSDFKNWLSAVISYQQSCLDGFDTSKDGEKEVMETFNTQSLDQIGKITGVALDIVADFSKILEQFGLKFDLKPASRRLLGAVEVDEEGLPTWLSASDRRLLGEGKGKGKKGGGDAGVIAPASQVGATVVVAKDGSGQFKTIKQAIDAYPANLIGRYVIHVKAGVYDEYITIPKKAVNILMYGDGPTKTIVTGRKNFAEGTKTMQTATFANTANGFIAKSMRFENTAGPSGHQAVALRNQGDMSAFFDCHILGSQDTLYTQSNRQFYRNCEIAGTIDFIFGVSPTLIQNSKIIVRKPNVKQFNTVTADGTAQPNMATGIVLQNCEIVADPLLFPLRAQIKSYLGRPWKPYSTTLIMESNISDVIHPEGWAPWDGNVNLNTLYYAEHANIGPGANVAGRIKWKNYHPNISKAEAARFTAAQFLKAGPTSNAADWLRATEVPFDIGFTKP